LKFVEVNESEAMEKQKNVDDQNKKEGQNISASKIQNSEAKEPGED